MMVKMLGPPRHKTKLLSFCSAGAHIVTRGNWPSTAPYQIWLDNVQCSGTESTIADCPHNVWGMNNCRHTEDIGIDCSSSKWKLDHVSFYLNIETWGGNQLVKEVIVLTCIWCFDHPPWQKMSLLYQSHNCKCIKQ